MAGLGMVRAKGKLCRTVRGKFTRCRKPIKRGRGKGFAKRHASKRKRCLKWSKGRKRCLKRAKVAGPKKRTVRTAKRRTIKRTSKKRTIKRTVRRASSGKGKGRCLKWSKGRKRCLQRAVQYQPTRKQYMGEQYQPTRQQYDSKAARRTLIAARAATARRKAASRAAGYRG